MKTLPIYEIEFRRWQGWMKMMFKDDKQRFDEEKRENSPENYQLLHESNEQETVPEDEEQVLAARRLHPAGMLFSFIKMVKDSIYRTGMGTGAFSRQSPTSARVNIGGCAILLIELSS